MRDLTRHPEEPALLTPEAMGIVLPRRPARRRPSMPDSTFTLLFEHNPLPTWLYDLQTLKVLLANLAAQAHYGYSDAEFRRLRMSDLTAPSEGDDGEVRMTSKGRARHRLRDGTNIDVHVEAHGLMYLGRPAVLAVMRDLTAEQDAASAVSDLEERYRRTIDGAPDAIITMDGDGLVSDWNRQATAIFGWSRGEAIGRRLSDLIIPEGHRTTHERGLPSAGEEGEGAVLSTRTEIEARHRDGHEFWVELSVVPLEAREGITFTAFVRDISMSRHDAEHLDRLISERTNQLREVNAELEKFVYTVSHDLRAPLRAMHGFARALLDDYGETLDPVALDFCERIGVAAGHMDELIQDLLAYSRLTRADMRISAIDAGWAIAAARDSLAAEIASSHARITVEPTSASVLAHGDTLVQVLTCLIDNAIKFVGRGVRPEVTVRAEENAGSVFVHVEDNGIGIAPEHQERIFGVFERLHGMEDYPGTGMGLALVRIGIERMSGRVSVQSEPGHGSRFTIELPRL